MSDKSVLLCPRVFVIFSILMTTQTLKNFHRLRSHLVMIRLALGSTRMTAARHLICGRQRGLQHRALQVISTGPWLRRSPAFRVLGTGISVFSVSRRF